MTWYNDSTRESSLQIVSAPVQEITVPNTKVDEVRTLICPSCGHSIQLQDQAKASDDRRKLHPLIDEFIPTIDGENGICYTHPEKLPGVSKDGQIRHFFHRPSKAYTTGTRKRRKVHTDADGGETRWHKTGKTRPVFLGGILKGYKKILVLYTNYGRQRKPEKTNWVMHQYHLGADEEEKDGELVVSKVFYQTQPRQCNTNVKEVDQRSRSLTLPSLDSINTVKSSPSFMEYYGSPPCISYNVGSQSPPQLIPNIAVHGDGSSFIQLPSGASKGK